MEWKREHPEFTDIIYEKGEEIARITINRLEKRNAIRRQTAKEIELALLGTWHDDSVGVIILTGVGNAFCSGGDVSERDAETGRYKGLEMDSLSTMVHFLIRSIPKPVIAMVNGYAIGGGHVYHVLCDLTVASEKAVFGQVGPRFGSFDAGFGAGYLARVVGEKKAREIWFLCRRYTAQEALAMGLVNWVVPHEKLEEETIKICKEITELSPTALKTLKYFFNAETDHLYGAERIGLSMLRLFQSLEEGREGSRAFLEKRKPEHSKFRKNL